MLSTSYQTILLILPLIISSTYSLPDNIFNKREAFAGFNTEGGSATGAPEGQPTGFHGKGFWGGCTDGWQACMSSICASAGSQTEGGGPPDQTGLTDQGPVATSAIEATGAECTATDGSCGGAVTTGAVEKKRRQLQTDAGLTTQAPVTGGPGPSATGGPDSQFYGHHRGNFGDWCSGFSDFMQSSGGVVTGYSQETTAAPPLETTGVDTAVAPVQS